VTVIFDRKFEEKPKPVATVALLIAPGATMFLAWLPAVSLTQGIWQKGFDPVSAFVVAPFWLGIVAAPGYMKAALTSEEFQPVWVRLSVVVALVASLGGAAAAIPLVLPVPFALASAVSGFLLLRRLRLAPSALARDGIVPRSRIKLSAPGESNDEEKLNEEN